MFGAITGDIIGSAYEALPTKRKDFALFTPVSTFTDDTVLTVAVAEALLEEKPIGPTLKAHARRQPLRGYGGSFFAWMVSAGNEPYNSFGNGSAMRVSPVAYVAQSEAECLQLAERSAECTHNHPEGIRGAQAVALGIFLARKGATKKDIRSALAGRFGYNFNRSIEEIRPHYRPDVTCQGSVPEAIIAFLDSHNFEDAIRNAVSLGGDADTQAAMAGGIAEAFYGGVPLDLAHRAWTMLPCDYQQVILAFHRRFHLLTNIAAIAAAGASPSPAAEENP